MRLLGWLSKLLISALLISFLSVFTTVYMVDLYINRFLEQWKITDARMPSMDVEDFVSKLTSPSQLWGHAQPDTPNQINGEEAILEDSSVTDRNTSSSNESMDSLDDDPAVPVFNNDYEANQSSSSRQKDTVVMSAEEFNEKRKKLTNQDKTAIFSIVVAKLPQQELQKMSLLLEDGITEEELGDLENVMNAYLHQDEVAQLLAILNKY
jgi:hypothetical protein